MPAKKFKTQNSKVKDTSKKSKISPRVKQSSLTIQVFDLKGKRAGTFSLPEKIFAAKVNPQLMAQAVRVYLANQRQGNASTKTRGQVRGSTRKIYRQKGTGRARHGGVRAPIFVHGGIAHGPKPHDFSLALPQKMKRLALFSALTAKLQDGRVKVVSGLEKIEPKTKNMAIILQHIGYTGKKDKILLVLPAKADAVQKAARNIQGLEMRLANQLNTYEVLRSKSLVFMKQAIETVEKTFVKE